MATSLQTCMAVVMVRVLSFECYESRRLLAALGLDIQLLADNNGAPGAPLSQPEQILHGPVEVGDTFWVRMTAWDGRQADAAGVISLPLNVTWDANVLSLLSALPADGGIDLTDPLVTSRFPLARRLADAGAGSLSRLQGAAAPLVGQGAAIGVNGPDEFSLLRFEALQVADMTPFSLALAGSMSFADGQDLSSVFHLVDGQESPAEPETQRVTEFIQIEQPPVEAAVSLSGFVFVDTNFDGVFNRQNNGQPIEVGLPNVTVQLYRQENAAYVLLQESLTGPDGWYDFDGLDPGVYRVLEVQPPGFLEGSVQLGSICAEQDCLPEGDPRLGVVQANAISDVQLRAGEQAVDYNFAERLSAAQVTKRMFLVSATTRGAACDLTQTQCVTVVGTQQDDAIRVDVGQDLVTVSVNDQITREVPLRDDRPVLVNIDARGGADQIQWQGGPQNESLWASPAYAIVQDVRVEAAGAAVRRSWRYAIAMDQAESVVASAGGGDNRAVLRDTPENDILEVGNNQALLRQAAAGATLQTEIDRFGRVRAVSAAGGQDLLQRLAAIDYTLAAVGRWLRA